MVQLWQLRTLSGKTVPWRWRSECKRTVC